MEVLEEGDSMNESVMDERAYVMLASAWMCFRCG